MRHNWLPKSSQSPGMGVCKADFAGMSGFAAEMSAAIGRGNLMEPKPRIDAAKLRRLATRIRLSATRMVAIQRLGYLCQAMSSAEIFAVLFGGGVIRTGYDRFILSPGHYTICLYAVAAEIGLIEATKLASYGKDGSELEAIGTERTPVADLV